MASDILEMNRDRKNRKNAEKMAIRVERRISDEGDGQENRIAASSVKCKENKAGWNFYQGQGQSRRCWPILRYTAWKQSLLKDSRPEITSVSIPHRS